jgi:hypothetical protein
VDRWVYLIGATAPIFLTAILLWRRHDLVKAAVAYGCIGGIVLLFCNYFFYEHDYWRPPNVFGTSPCVEDFLFGFGITTFPLVVYPCVMQKRFIHARAERHIGIFAVFAVISVSALAIGSRIFHIDSILISIILLTGFTATVCIVRSDLTAPARFAIVSLTLTTLPLYFLLFVVVVPNWWRDHWMLSHSCVGVMILGHVPLLELLCYPAWAGLAATGHPFILGLRLGIHRD